MSNTKDIQRRIKSVESTQKITRAMEMVAATKMKRAVEAVFQSRRYANLGWMTILNITNTISNGQPLHPFLDLSTEQPKKIGVVLISSNRGLCGSFNSNVVNKMHKAIEDHKKNTDNGVAVEINILGKKGHMASEYYGYNIIREFPKNDLVSKFEEITPVARVVMDNFLNGTHDTVYVAYTDYVSSSKQIPRIKQLLPINIQEKDEYLGKVARVFGKTGAIEETDDKENGFADTEYEFEPSAKQVLEGMLPRLIEAQLYQALLESNASEHSVRMAAMHQATDAADDMINELRLNYNKARQAAITSEISEISAGVEALSTEE